MTPDDFMECPACAAKPGSPPLCESCLNNRGLIDRLRRAIVEERKACHDAADEIHDYKFGKRYTDKDIAHNEAINKATAAIRARGEGAADDAMVLEMEGQRIRVDRLIEFLAERVALLEGRVQELEQRGSTSLPKGVG